MKEVIFDVENVFTKITAEKPLLDALDAAFSYFVDGYRQMPRFKEGKWDGKKHLLTPTGRFPTGLLEDAQDIADQKGYEIVINDHRIRPELNLKPLFLRGADEREHQIEAIDAALECERGIIWHATGSGKCLTPETQVLTADLLWNPVKNLKVGQILVGFDEESNGTPRHLKPSVVLNTGTEILPCYQITLTTGEKLEATGEHKWLIVRNKPTKKGGSNIQWKTTAALHWSITHKARRQPVLMPRYFKPWVPDMSNEAGYLRGLYDGEGSVRNRKGQYNGLSFSQKNTIVLEEAKQTLGKLKYSYRERAASGGVNNLEVNTYEGIELLGKIRPKRLLNKWNNLRWPMLASQTFVEIKDIEFIGNREVITLQTSTETFIAEGFGSHNTNTMAGILQVLNQPSILLVHSAGIARQTRKRFIELLGRRDIGLYTGGTKTDGFIVCATFQSLQTQYKKDKENQTQILRKWLSKFNVICVDEGHHTLARTYQAVINECDAYFRYGFSATPMKSIGISDAQKGARLHIIGSTGPVLDRYKAGEGVNDGYIVKANATMRQWHPDNPKTYWKANEFEINDRAFTYTGKKTKVVEKIVNGKLRKVRVPLPPSQWEPGLYDVAIAKNIQRNNQIVKAAIDLYEDDRTVLVLVERIDQGLHLQKEIIKQTGHPVIFLRGEDSPNTRDAAKRKLATGESKIMVATTIFDEGEDVPVISGLVPAAGGKAQHRLIQRLGRGMRPEKGKQDLRVIDFYDTHSRTMWRHAKSREQVYRSDPDAYSCTIEKINN